MKNCLYFSLLISFTLLAEENEAVWYSNQPAGQINMYEQMLWQQHNQSATNPSLQAAQPPAPTTMNDFVPTHDAMPSAHHSQGGWALPPEWQNAPLNQPQPAWQWHSESTPNPYNTPWPVR